MPFEHRVQVAEPFDGLGGRHDVDHAVFAAVERRALLLRLFQRRREEILEIRLGRAALGIGTARTDVAVRRLPVGALVGEVVRLIEMEVIDDVIVIRRVELRQRFRAVPAIAAQKHITLRRKGADAPDRLARDALPRREINLLRHLVEQLKHHALVPCAVARGKALPDRIELFLIRRALKKARLVLAGVKGEALGLVKIEHDMQSILFGQRQRTVDACKAVLLHRAVLALDHIIIDRDAHMVEAPAADLGKIVFGNKAVEPLVAVIALAHPAAEIDAAVKSEFLE